MACWPNPIKAIIFDNDGTFLDTNWAYIDAINLVVGQPMSQEFFNSINGTGAKAASKKIVAEFKLNMTPDEFLSKRDAIVSKLLIKSKPFPGVVELARRFKKMGYKIGLATSADADKTKIKFSNQPDILNIFDVVLTSSDASKLKPDPEIFLKCAEKLGNFDPSNVLVFEDAYNGISAANNAGMASAFFANGNNDYDKLFEQFKCSPSYVFQTYDSFDMSKFIWS
ncbi:Pseudouridine-5'-phosphatase [Tritrichomonas musculus]|uniref:Pseudouridine-5'-phosphatase n=1 Tax=Tritrichomonas musculus TaxID=1915356 RepID=A0ABR2J1K5_9EUKA